MNKSKKKLLPGEESVWDYPRPPKLEKFNGHVRIIFQDEIIADSNQAYRVLETSHPSVFYIPIEDISKQFIRETPQKSSFCEYKGMASYYDVIVKDKHVKAAAWTYRNPTESFLPIKNHLAFYPSKMDACYVNDELAQPQEGDFYGGWITKNIKGPFKGGQGTWGW